MDSNYYQHNAIIPNNHGFFPSQHAFSREEISPRQNTEPLSRPLTNPPALSKFPKIYFTSKIIKNLSKEEKESRSCAKIIAIQCKEFNEQSKSFLMTETERAIQRQDISFLATLVQKMRQGFPQINEQEIGRLLHCINDNVAIFTNKEILSSSMSSWVLEELVDYLFQQEIVHNYVEQKNELITPLINISKSNRWRFPEIMWEKQLVEKDCAINGLEKAIEQCNGSLLQRSLDTIKRQYCKELTSEDFKRLLACINGNAENIATNFFATDVFMNTLEEFLSFLLEQKKYINDSLATITLVPIVAVFLKKQKNIPKIRALLFHSIRNMQEGNYFKWIEQLVELGSKMEAIFLFKEMLNDISPELLSTHEKAIEQWFENQRPIGSNQVLSPYDKDIDIASNELSIKMQRLSHYGKLRKESFKLTLEKELCQKQEPSGLVTFIILSICDKCYLEDLKKIFRINNHWINEEQGIDGFSTLLAYDYFLYFLDNSLLSPLSKNNREIRDILQNSLFLYGNEATGSLIQTVGLELRDIGDMIVIRSSALVEDYSHQTAFHAVNFLFEKIANEDYRILLCDNSGILEITGAWQSVEEVLFMLQKVRSENIFADVINYFQTSSQQSQREQLLFSCISSCKQWTNSCTTSNLFTLTKCLFALVYHKHKSNVKEGIAAYKKVKETMRKSMIDLLDLQQWPQYSEILDILKKKTRMHYSFEEHVQYITELINSIDQQTSQEILNDISKLSFVLKKRLLQEYASGTMQTMKDIISQLLSSHKRQKIVAAFNVVINLFLQNNAIAGDLLLHALHYCREKYIAPPIVTTSLAVILENISEQQKANLMDIIYSFIQHFFAEDESGFQYLSHLLSEFSQSELPITCECLLYIIDTFPQSEKISILLATVAVNSSGKRIEGEWCRFLKAFMKKENGLENVSYLIVSLFYPYRTDLSYTPDAESAIFDILLLVSREKNNEWKKLVNIICDKVQRENLCFLKLLDISSSEHLYIAIRAMLPSNILENMSHSQSNLWKCFILALMKKGSDKIEELADKMLFEYTKGKNVEHCFDELFSFLLATNSFDWVYIAEKIAIKGLKNGFEFCCFMPKEELSKIEKQYLLLNYTRKVLSEALNNIPHSIKDNTADQERYKRHCFSLLERLGSRITRFILV